MLTRRLLLTPNRYDALCEITGRCAVGFQTSIDERDVQMPVNKNVSSDANTVTIAIKGMFDLSVQQDFRKAYEEEEKTKDFIIDMHQTEYMDSAAFGMLLVFRDYLGGDKAKVVIKNASDDIKKSFEILQFDRMFLLE